MIADFEYLASFACQTAGNNLARATVLVEKALEFLKHIPDESCDLRTEWFCNRSTIVRECNLCPACDDKKLYDKEQAEIADKTCIKRNNFMLGIGCKLGDDCGREDIALGPLGRNCYECPACDDLINLFNEYESAKNKKTISAVENVAKQAAKKIRYIQARNRLI